MNLIQLALTMLTLAGSQAMASPQHYDSWEAFQSAHSDVRCPGFSASSFEGDLNEDGVLDRVVLINPDRHHSQLFVLLGEEHGGYQVSGQSDVFEWGCDLAPTTIAQDGSNRFHIQFDQWLNGKAEGETLRFHFALRGGSWRWTGEDDVTCSRADTAKELTRRETLSVDFLSGHYVDVFQYAGKRVKTERGRRRFPVLLLRDFYYYNNPVLRIVPFKDEWFWNEWSGNYCD